MLFSRFSAATPPSCPCTARDRSSDQRLHEKLIQNLPWQKLHDNYILCLTGFLPLYPVDMPYVKNGDKLLNPMLAASKCQECFVDKRVNKGIFFFHRTCHQII